MSNVDEARTAEVLRTEARLNMYRSLCKQQYEVIKGYEEQEAVWLTLVRDIEFECDGHEDIDNNGGPNFAMRVMNHVRVALEKTGVEL